jgi:glycosyltransferase involved in cell wall biosynthesis
LAQGRSDLRLRFITSTPMNVFTGSGTFVGVSGLAQALRKMGVEVELVVPSFKLPIYTVQRVSFNQMLRFRSLPPADVTVGFDMDGYTISSEGRHVASIKGVIADEMRFESGLTHATMRWQACCERLNVRRAGLVITTSRYAAGRIRELYEFDREIAIVPELMDVAAWQGLLAANAAQREPGKFVVLSVCRFYPRKRLDVLLGAADRLREKIPGLQVRIVGGGPEATKLRRIWHEKRLQETVVWLEDISQAELLREYNRCDVFCLPSVQEGFGLVFLEAMAAGKPIVAVRAGAAPEVVPHGLLAKPDDEEDLAEKILCLCQNVELRRSLAVIGLEFIQQFDAPEVARMFLNAIQPLVHDSADRPKTHVS